MILDSPLLNTGGPGRVDYELVLHTGVKEVGQGAGSQKGHECRPPEPL
jgi:hypothetical protein